MGIGETNTLTLTKVSDTAQVIELNAALDKGGAPRIDLGSVTQEAAAPAERGSIRIESLHHGSGQRVARNPRKFLSNQGSAITELGWQTWVEGQIATNKWIADREITNNTTYTEQATHRAGRIFQTADKSWIVVTGGQILDSPDSITWVARAAPPDGATSRFTGSAVVYGDRSFYAAESSLTREGEQVEVRSNAGVYAGAAFDANHLAIVGARMFRLRYDATNEIWYVSWTDQMGVDTPTFSTEYPVPAGGRTRAAMEAVSGQVVIGLSGASGQYLGTVFYAVDTEGTITPLTVDDLGIGTIVSSGTLMGKPAFLISAAQPVIVWLQTITDVAVLSLDAVATDGVVATYDVRGGLSGIGDTVWAVFGTELVVGVMSNEGWNVHQVGSGWYRSSSKIYPLAVRARPEGQYTRVEVLWVDDFPTTESLKLTVYWIHAGSKISGHASTTQTNTLITSIYNGGIWVSKKFTRVRGYVHVQAVNDGTFTITAYVDGVARGSGTITASGAFSITLTDAAVGRGVHLVLETAVTAGDGYACVVELPLDIDYFFNPDQKDTLRVAVRIGRDQLTQGGTIDRRGKVTVEEELTAMVAAPEPWTLHFEDGRADWTVLPVDFEGPEVEAASRPGGEVGVRWLTVQRL